MVVQFFGEKSDITVLRGLIASACINLVDPHIPLSCSHSSFCFSPRYILFTILQVRSLVMMQMECRVVALLSSNSEIKLLAGLSWPDCSFRLLAEFSSLQLLLMKFPFPFWLSVRGHSHLPRASHVVHGLSATLNLFGPVQLSHSLLDYSPSQHTWPSASC